MTIKEITNKNQWEKFIQFNKDSTFLQSWNWGEFNKNTGEKIWRIGVFNEHEQAAAALIIKINAKRGSFLFIPHGPIIKSETNNQKSKILKMLFDYIKNLGKIENVGFIRVSSLFEKTQANLETFRKFGFINAPIHMMHPEITWLLNIEDTEEEILKNMKKTHRNLIRRAEKEGVKIIKNTNEKYLKAFYNIHMETVKRHKFIPFSFDFIKTEIDTFVKDNEIEIFSAIYKEKIISSAIIVFYGNQAFYHHGASSSEFNKIPSSYLTLFEAIKEAKRREKKIFNFYGIVENKPKHPWSGLSKFKQGFGGYKQELLHCQDLPLKNKYIITWFIEEIRKIKRGY